MHNITAEVKNKKLNTRFLVNGIPPDSILSILQIPVIKGKARKLNGLKNYRLIALPIILSKVLGVNRLEQ